MQMDQVGQKQKRPSFYDEGRWIVNGRLCQNRSGSTQMKLSPALRKSPPRIGTESAPSQLSRMRA